MIRRLCDLVAPASEEHFLDCLRRKRTMVVRTADRGRGAALVRWDAVNYLLDAGVIPASRVRVTLARTVVAPIMFRSGDELRGSALNNLANQGATIVINSIDDYLPDVACLIDSIKRRTRNRAWANLYITFGPSGAFKAHFDPHDVIALQLYGNKRWRGFGVKTPHPTGHGREVAVETHTWEELLEPGDALFVPRGEVHDAVAEAVPSMHLAVGILGPIAADVLKWALTEAEARDEVLRMDAMAPDDERSGRAEQFRTHARALADSASVERFLETHEVAALPGGRLALGLPSTMSDDTWLMPGRITAALLHPEVEGELEVATDGTAHRLSAGERRVLAELVRTDGTTFAQLTASMPSSADDLRKLVLRLAALGLCGAIANR